MQAFRACLVMFSIDYFKDLEAGEDGGRFSSAQIQGLLQSAKKAWGRVSQWSAQRLRSLRSLATRFPVQYLTQLDANAVLISHYYY